VSGAQGLVDYSCTYGASVTAGADELWVAVEVPVTSLCPCSKAISRHGAHNQRSLVRVKVWFARFFWLEDLIALIEDSASCDLYPCSSVRTRSGSPSARTRGPDS